MRITDYEHSGTLKDVAISLSRDEAEELSLYLNVLLRRPGVHSVHLSEIQRGRIEKDIRFNLAEA